MEAIPSTKNPYIKELRSLKERKNRRALGKFIAEGEKCALEALHYGQVESVLAAEDSPAVQEALERGVRTIRVSRAVLEAVCEARHPQPSLAVVRQKAETPPEEAPPGIYVALENVSDPQNVGTIIRTADAVGAAGVLLSKGSADYTGPKAVRAAMGSVFHLPIWVAEDFSAVLKKWKNQGMFLVAGHLKGGEAPIPEKPRLCVLIGNEADGLLDETSQMADLLYKIPIYGRAESLNAAVAAGILLYRARTGR